MSRVLIAVCMLLFSQAAFADSGAEVKDLYRRFAAAQNAHDAAAISAELVQSPQFLWVSDGKSFWGPEIAIKRMSMFQGSEVWRVVPALDQARVVDLDEKSAFLHMPLELIIGSAAQPDHLHFLVSILCVKNDGQWKIAALFTTTAKPE